MEERIYQGLIGFTILCVATSFYLAFAIGEGPKPVHEIRQASPNDKQSSALAAVNCGSGAPPAMLKQAESSVTSR